MIAVGPGATDKQGKVVPMAVKAGDRVLLPGWGGNAIKVGEDVRNPAFLRLSCRTDTIPGALQEYHLFRDSEILAKIQE